MNLETEYAKRRACSRGAAMLLLSMLVAPVAIAAESPPDTGIYVGGAVGMSRWG